MANLKIGEIVEIIPGMETDAAGIWNVPAGMLVLCKKEDGTFTYASMCDMEVIDYEPVDWSAFRREAAKDILCSLLSRVERFYTGVSDGTNRITNHADFVTMAIADADELIRQLKED